MTFCLGYFLVLDPKKQGQWEGNEKNLLYFERDIVLTTFGIYKQNLVCREISQGFPTLKVQIKFKSNFPTCNRIKFKELLVTFSQNTKYKRNLWFELEFQAQINSKNIIVSVDFSCQIKEKQYDVKRNCIFLGVQFHLH